MNECCLYLSWFELIIEVGSRNQRARGCGGAGTAAEGIFERVLVRQRFCDGLCRCFSCVLKMLCWLECRRIHHLRPFFSRQHAAAAGGVANALAAAAAVPPVFLSSRQGVRQQEFAELLSVGAPLLVVEIRRQPALSEI